MIRTVRFETTHIEEIETPRPHYKVSLTAQIFRRPVTSSATAGLIPDEITATVHAPIAVGTDLKIIKQAARDLALDSIKMLMQPIEPSVTPLKA